MHGFVHLYNGQEAVSAGFIKLLNKDNSIYSNYHDHVHALSKVVSTRAIMAELYGRTTGCFRCQGDLMHMFSKEHNLLGGYTFIGEGIPIATGAAFASKYYREVMKEGDCDDVTCGLLWGWGLQQWAILRVSKHGGLMEIAIVFVVENNLWAIGMSHL
ncbi:hypothetical protein AAC387_Pa05g0730 [Persea americana]